MDFIIRKAENNDKTGIAQAIADSFKKDFSGFSRDTERIAKALENGININRFFVAEQKGKIIGIVASADCFERALTPSKKDCKKHLGFIRGIIAHYVFKIEFSNPLTFPADTGCFDILGVVEEAQGKGAGKALIQKVIEENSQYKEFVLNVTDVNKPAIRLYQGFGFVEYERVPYKFAKQAGFKEKIWMKYVKDD